MQRILWLSHKNMSKSQQMMLQPFLMKRGINHAQIIFVSIEQKFDKYRIWKGKNKWVLDGKYRASVTETIARYITQLKPGAIVINDDVALMHLVGQRSLDTCRGSIYHINKIPTLVLDSVLKLHAVKEFSWQLLGDLAKLKRWMDGLQRVDARFSYTLCKSVDDLQQFASLLDNGLNLAVDIETGKDYISSVGFSLLCNDGRVHVITVPLACPLNVDGCYWSEADEIRIWELFRIILRHEIAKIFQNGLYDCAWFIRFGCEVINWICDTMHGFHSIFCEAPQDLAYITAYLCDNYRYWKDEIKGFEKDENVATRMPSEREGLELFWRYNGLDAYYTLIDWIYLVRLLTAKNMEWALVNYCQEIRMEVGPCLAMTMRGMKCDEDRQIWYYEKWGVESAQAREDLRAMAADEDFNPNSSQQVGVFLYDILGAKPIRLRGKGKDGREDTGRRSTDEKVLKFVALQHPLYSRVIETIWEMKKPLNSISNYGKMELNCGRFLYSLSMRTETGRLNSSNHPSWYGRNAQNWPDEVREMLVADDGWIIFDADYSQSDSYFIAFYSEDEQMIRNVLDERDTHCIHAEFFFKEPYEKVHSAYKSRDEKTRLWATHPTKGVRQNSKRINHGANYRMRGGTLYIVMGHEALVSTAVAMGQIGAHKWTDTKCRKFAQYLLDLYTQKLYPRLPKWYKESVDAAVANSNRVTVFGGRTRLFFGDIQSRDDIQRELSAYYGQGGTAGNINRALDSIYYSKLEVGGGTLSPSIKVHVQAHDALIGQVKLGHFDKLDKLLTIMRAPVTIGEREFLIPVECEVGLSWGKGGLIKYKPNNPNMIVDIQANERKLQAKFDGPLM